MAGVVAGAQVMIAKHEAAIHQLMNTQCIHIDKSVGRH